MRKGDLMTVKDKGEEKGRMRDGEELLLLMMVWWLLDCSRVSEERLPAFLSLLSCVFDVKTREKSSQMEKMWFKRILSWVFFFFFPYIGASLLIFLDFPRLLLKLVESWCRFGFWVRLTSLVPDTSCPTVHPLRERADFRRSVFPVSFSMLWCRNRRAAMCRDAGTLYSQTAAGMSMNLSASHLCSPPLLPLSNPPPRINDCLPSFTPNQD